MTSTDDILNQIDGTLRDTSVSIDAMRCGPEPDDEPIREAVREATRTAVDAMRPAMENLGRAMQQLAAAARAAGFSSLDDFALAPPQPSLPDDRPARRRL